MMIYSINTSSHEKKYYKISQHFYTHYNKLSGYNGLNGISIFSGLLASGLCHCFNAVVL